MLQQTAEDEARLISHPPGPKAACLLSTNWMHAMPTGLAFCGPSENDVAVVAMDNEEVRVYRAS